MQEPTVRDTDAVPQDASEITAPLDASMFNGEHTYEEKESDKPPPVVEEEKSEENSDKESAEDVDKVSEENEGAEDDVHSQEVNIDSIESEDIPKYLDQLYDVLDDEARKEWLSGREGRIGKEVGKFRKSSAKDKELREAAEAKYDALFAQTQTTPDNPFANLLTSEDVEKKSEAINSDLKYVETWLNSGEDYLTVGDKEYSIAEVAKWPISWAKQLRQLDKQASRVKSITKSKEKAAKVESALSDDYEWFDDEDSSQKQEYHKMRNDPKWSMVLDFVPELADVLPKVLAKFVSDVPASKKAKTGIPIHGKRRARGNLGNASGGAGTSDKKAKSRAKALERLKSGVATETDGLSMFM
jgi:hypothetical protein